MFGTGCRVKAGMTRGNEIEADMANFVLLSKAKYMELLEKYGTAFFV